jgi:hypothetical protein
MRRDQLSAAPFAPAGPAWVQAAQMRSHRGEVREVLVLNPEELLSEKQRMREDAAA